MISNRTIDPQYAEKRWEHDMAMIWLCAWLGSAVGDANLTG